MDTVHELIAGGTDLAAGANTLDGTAVGVGKIQKITNITYKYTGTVTSVRFSISAGGKVITETAANPVSGQVYEWNGQVYLKATEKISVAIAAATLHDVAVINVHGLEMAA
jgi:hypothetical protein